MHARCENPGRALGFFERGEYAFDAIAIRESLRGRFEYRRRVLPCTASSAEGQTRPQIVGGRQRILYLRYGSAAAILEPGALASALMIRP